MSLATIAPKCAPFAGLAGLLLVVSCSRAPTTGVLALAPAGMSPTRNARIAPDGSLVFWGNGSLQAKVYLQAGPVTIAVNARGNPVDGEAPMIAVDLEGQPLGKLAVQPKVLKDYSVQANMESAGTKTLRLTFGNYVPQPDPLASRHLTINKITITQNVG